MNTCIKNGFIITSDETCSTVNGCVHVTDGVITYVGADSLAPNFSAERTIDVSGDIIAPGFVNTHTHIPMNLFRGYANDMTLMDWLENAIWPAEEKLTGDDVYWGSMLGMAELIAGGVTCFNDMYNFMFDTVKAADDSGIRGVVGATIIDLGKSIDERLAEADELFARVKDYDRIDAAIAPHSEYTVSAESFGKLIKTAHKHNSRIHVHVSETQGEHEGCIKRNGQTAIARLKRLGVLDLPTMAAHCVWVSDSDMEIMADKNVGVMSCPQSNLKIGSGIARISKLIDHGIKVSCATDGAGSNNNLSMMEEMTLIAMLQKGTNYDPKLIPAKTAVQIATINGAKVIGQENKIGSLEVGKQADIIVIDTSGLRYCPSDNLLNHMVYSGSDSDVVLTMVGGEILYENGEFSRIDVAEVMAKANSAASRLLA